MKGILVKEPKSIEIIDLEKPNLDEKNNVLVKIKVAGICGSDIHIYHGTNPAVIYPRIIGHEMVGVVDEIFGNVTKVKIGDRVIIDQVVSCGECYACKKGRSNVCGNLSVRGVHQDGGYREYISVPEDSVYILPDELSFIDAVMIEPTTIAIQSCSRAELKSDDILLIYGYGALGSSIFRIAKLSGATIIVTDICENKLNEAKIAGANYIINSKLEDLNAKIKEITNGYGVTVSIDSACIGNSLEILMQVTGNAGRVITMGFSLDKTPVTQFGITSKELDIRGSRLQNKKFQDAIDLIKDNKLDLKGSVSHSFDYFDVQKAFDFIDSKDSSIRKVVLTFGE